MNGPSFFSPLPVAPVLMGCETWGSVQTKFQFAFLCWNPHVESLTRFLKVDTVRSFKGSQGD